MYSTGDHVFHNAMGVCEIIGIRREKFAGLPEQEYYLIKPQCMNSVSYISTSHEPSLAKIRPVLTEDEVRRLIRGMPDERTFQAKSSSERRDLFIEKLETGDSHNLVRLIKTMYYAKVRKASAGKRLDSTEAKIMATAERLLHGEIAFVLRIATDAVLPFIRSELH